MHIEKLRIEHFGPFESYEIGFVPDDSCMLLTGKNNEGKSTIIRALQFLEAGTRSIGKNQYKIVVDGERFYSLPKADLQDVTIGRFIHNYENQIGSISAEFDDGFEIEVFLNPVEDLVYADYRGRISGELATFFAPIPALGPLAESEEILSKKSYIRSSFRTSLAPRHLRNTMYQILAPHEYALVQEIVDRTWPSIRLMNIDVDYRSNQINVFFEEDRIPREICWAGQGLQVWFQIVTHLVRLRNHSFLILDEPEIFLHPEKQNDLVRLISEYFSGSTLIATHSVELMNNVSVSHIVNVQKRKKKPVVKTTGDRRYLETVRSEIGSTFNLIASQFERFEYIVLTEDSYDFNLIAEFAAACGLGPLAFNIPIHGFQEYRKARAFREAYEILIGSHARFIMVLDRDYYPGEYLRSIQDESANDGVTVVFTEGKEIENTLIDYPAVSSLFAEAGLGQEFELLISELSRKEHDSSLGSFITLHKKFLDVHKDVKTIIEERSREFRNLWESDPIKFKPGKTCLKAFRQLYKEMTAINLTDSMLIKARDAPALKSLSGWIRQIFAET